MSATNPNVKEILANSTGVIGQHLCKSYLNLARMAFRKKHKRFPTIDDAQEVRDIYEAEWRDWYIDKPAREKANREKGKPIWKTICRHKLQGRDVIYEYLNYKYRPWAPMDTKMDYYFDKIRGEYGQYRSGSMTEMIGTEYLESFIIDSGQLDEFNAFVEKHLQHLPKYRKPRYTDWSHLAYNGVTDDF